MKQFCYTYTDILKVRTSLTDAYTWHLHHMIRRMFSLVSENVITCSVFHWKIIFSKPRGNARGFEKRVERNWTKNK